MYVNKAFDCIDSWLRNKDRMITKLALTIIQLNIRGMNELGKFDAVGELLDRYGKRVDVVVLGETWLKTDTAKLFSLDGYFGIFSCRDESHGGLAVFIRKDLKYTLCANRVFDGFHHIHLSLQIDSKPVQLHAVYRPPSFDSRRFLSAVESMLSAGGKSKDCILVGDMNIPVNRVSNNIVSEYVRLLESYGAFVTNTVTTRPASANILDHVVCSGHIANDVVNDTISHDLSDHCIIVSQFKTSCTSTKHSFAKNVINHDRLNEIFAQQCAQLPVSGNANDKLEYVTRTYQSAKAQCTKTVTLETKLKKHCPWMTFDLIKLIRIKENALRKHRRNPENLRNKELLDRACKLLQQTKATCKRNYYYRQLDRSDAKTAWKFINRSLGKQHADTQISSIELNGQTVTGADNICRAFNDHFCNIGPLLASDINSDLNIHKFGTLIPQQNSLYLYPTSTNEVVILISKLDIKKSSGPDDIPACFIKTHHLFFAQLITDVFNEIIHTGQYPDCLKLARVVPIFKSGNTKDLNNYRPISCLSILDKVIEKLLASRITAFTQRFNLIYAYQYGFRSGSSTLSACSDLVDDIYGSLDSKKIAAALFIDLKKAFDTVDHSMLVKKLDILGFRGVTKSLLQSYLTDRHQFVAIGSNKSSPGVITTGVPQGSNLGPILFLLFINDISKLPLKGKLRLFADDTSLLYEANNIDDLQRQIEYDIVLLKDFFDTNLLSLNLRKTKYMIFHSPKKQLPVRDALQIQGCQIEEVTEYLFLGLKLDSTLKWTAHINDLKNKLSSICGVFRKISSFIPRKWLLKLYHALFHSRLQYLVTCWGTASISVLKELQVIQNRCLKIIYGRPRLYPTLDLYKESHDSILPVKALYNYQTLMQVWKILSDNATHHNTLLRRVTRIRESRHDGNLVLQRLNSEFGRKKFVHAGSTLYNGLPVWCKLSPSYNCFKLRLRKHLKEHMSTFML